MFGRKWKRKYERLWDKLERTHLILTVDDGVVLGDVNLIALHLQAYYGRYSSEPLMFCSHGKVEVKYVEDVD